LLENVPGRSGIEIHTGVFPSDTHGCIIVGESFEFLRDRGIAADGVAYSTKAYSELFEKVGNADEFTLSIVES
jgi:hypothetical protein